MSEPILGPPAEQQPSEKAWTEKSDSEKLRILDVALTEMMILAEVLGKDDPEINITVNRGA